MPEIPEMELYKINLNKYLAGKKIKDIVVHREKSINYTKEEFCNALLGNSILDINRRGKFLIFKLSNNFLLTHMMLDGRLFYLPPEIVKTTEFDLQDAEGLKKTIHGMPGKPSVIFIFEDSSILFFCRLTLGYLHFLSYQELQEHLKNLGADPLADDFKVDDFIKLIKVRRGKIKPWLMNQKYLAGVGNAYANECLFEPGVKPNREISSLADQEKENIFYSLRNILKKSIDLGGDMEEAFSPNDKFTGGFNPYFNVYEREGQECRVCSNTIIREELAGRNTFYCPHCQK